MKYIAMILALFLLAPKAQAQFKVGGGCFTQMSDGQLCEDEDSQHLERIDVATELAFLQTRTTQIPSLIENLREISKTRQWDLDDRAFNPVYCAPQGLSAAPSGQAIVGCQDLIEVRVQKIFWQQASLKDRSELVLHEIMTAYFLDHGGLLEQARQATHLILNDLQDDPQKVRNQLRQLQLPLMTTRLEMDLFDRFLLNEKSLICAGDKKATQTALFGYFENYEDRALLARQGLDLRTFRPDYFELVQSHIDDIFAEIELLPSSCQSDEAYSKLFLGLLAND